MGIPADRVSGAFFFLFGLAMYFLIIPEYVELNDEGNLSPNTMPNIISLVIAFFGAVLVLKPTPHQLQNMRYFVMTGTYIGILAAGIYAMSLFGFEYVGPVMALAIMLIIGERRPLWLGAGVIIMPLLIWFLVTYVLGRALP